MTDDAFHLTALDARRYDFGNALRGYDRTRVDQFRDQVAEELERLSRANQELDHKARSFHEQLKAFRERDKAMNEALVSAQQLRGEIRQQAEREAQLIVREAGAEAERQLQQVQNEVRRAEDELQALWRARRNFLTGLRHSLERQLGELNAAESEPMPSFGGLRESASSSQMHSRANAPAGSAIDDEMPELRELRELPPRAASPTPSWLDIVDEK
ncbi:MAG TPA: DivIVA domain-containing protein [Gemmatimonas sp.]|nr:DivIVA domain-containing protein [Gemmatimonas sp.]